MTFKNKMVIYLYENREDFLRGKVKAARRNHNLVTNSGAGDFLITAFAASSYTAQFYIAPFTGIFVVVGVT